MAIATALLQIEVSLSPFPTPGEPVWDKTNQEWVLTDSDGIAYFGDTPGECCRQFVEALHCMAQHARRSLYGVEDLLDYRTQPISGSADLLPLAQSSSIGGHRER